MYKGMKNEVVTLVTPVGEIVGRLSKVDDESLTLSNPRLFVHGGEEGAGFAPGVSMTGEPNPSSVTFVLQNVFSVVKTHADIERGWQQATSGIVLT